MCKSRGLSIDLADELLQDFVCDKVLAAQIVRKADKGRGRFRNFLLKSLNNYVNTQLERLKRERKHIAGGDALEGLAAPMDAGTFDREWVTLVVEDTLKRVQEDCERRGRKDLWSILQLRVVRPMLFGEDPETYENIILRFDLKTPKQAMNRLASAKLCFIRNLRLVVGQYVEGPQRIQEEVDFLLNTVG
jgi:hypothetical protein